MDTNSARNLSDTLILALNQSQEQRRTIDEQAARIQGLEQENERLRLELTAVSKKTVHKSHKASLNDQLPKLDKLIQKDAEAQAEISYLKRKLKKYKEKVAQQPDAHKPSSTIVSCKPEATSLHNSTQLMIDAVNEFVAMSERLRGEYRRGEEEGHVLAEIPVNMRDPTRVSLPGSGHKKPKNRRIAAISSLTEDGEVYHPDANIAVDQHQSLPVGPGQKQLDSLLNAPAPNKPSLHRPTSPRAVTGKMHVDSGGRPRFPVLSAEQELATVSAHQKSAKAKSESKALSISTMGGKPTNLGSKAPNDDEALSARPLHRLALNHFRPNKQWLDTENMSCEDFLKGKNAQRIRMLAQTLPMRMTDQELLQEHLGPDSEQQIASLKDYEKKQLIAEAKLAIVASSFGKVRQDYDREEEPPGFWQLDFPCTQEVQENRDMAKDLEREEVKRRYGEAIKGNGRWLFADQAG